MQRDITWAKIEISVRTEDESYMIRDSEDDWYGRR